MAALKDRYAAALFEMSMQGDALDAHLNEAAHIKAWLGEAQFSDFLENPQIKKSKKRALIEEIFFKDVSDMFMGFLRFAIDKGRAAYILPTIRAYIELGEAHNGNSKAYVVSASALRQAQLDAISGVLEQKLMRRVQIVSDVDPALIGGFIIRVDGHLIDRSVRAQLESLKENLKESLKRGGPDDRT